MDEFEQRSREIARAILERHGWKRPMSAEVKEMREIADEPLMECKRYLLEEWQNMRIPLLEKENAKLREELDFCLKHVPNCDGCEAMLDCWECLRADSSQKERKRLDYENEKLRGLVRELLTDPDAWDYDYFKYRMRELGIEVE